MKRLLLLISLFATLQSFAQTFSVNADDPKSKQAFINQLKYDGYKIDSVNFDYSLNYFVAGQYKLSLKKPYQGYATITNKDGKELARSKEVKTNPAALNGFNAAYGMVGMIIKRHLPEMLKKLK